mgnify:CR=1 FL=1
MPLALDTSLKIRSHDNVDEHLVHLNIGHPILCREKEREREREREKRERERERERENKILWATSLTMDFEGFS